MTQCEMVMDYIKTFGSITTMEAFTDLGVTRLASRICDLSKKGVEFERTTETRRNRYGDKVSFTRYSIAKGEEA